MTTETDLLPCPWCGEKLASVSVSEGSTFRWRKVDGCCADGPEVRHDTMADDQVAAEVESRAAAIAAWNRRANVAHAVAPLQAEIEALRELCGMAYQLAGVHDAPEKWLDALSSAAAGRPFSTDGLLPYMPQAVCAAEAHAKRLAEALREAKEKMLAQVKWVACDCGCEGEKPADAVSIAWLRASAMLSEQEAGRE